MTTRTTSSHRRRRRLLLAPAALALTLAACGGDDDSASDDTASQSSSTAGGSSATTGAGSDAPADTGTPTATAAPAGTQAPATEAPAATEAPSPDGDFDPCSLVTPEDLEAAFGSPFDAGEATHHEQTGGDQCVWGNTDAPPVKTFSIAVNRDGHFEGALADLTAAELHEQNKQVYTDAEPIEGLGDDAYSSGTSIAVLDGGTLYEFSTFLGTSDEAMTGLRSLAEQVING